jgi:glycosyltransferase involved in cell wall biosynthesis
VYRQSVANGEVVVAVIPALDEEESVGAVVREVAPYVDHVVVVDNGSVDRTREVALGAGAVVVVEPRRGYGSACLAGALKARELGATILVTLDGDGANAPDDAPALLAPLLAGEADLALGIRTRASIEPGSMAPVQRFGNWFAPLMMRLLTGAGYRDMPAFKAIRMHTLERLDIQDVGHGYPIELLLKAHAQQIRSREIVTRWRARRAGASKISGTVRGTVRASVKIVSMIAKHTWLIRAGRS